MGKDKVPSLSDSTNYTEWKRRVMWWAQATTVKKEARAATLIMNMAGKPESVAIQLNHETLSVEGGVALLIKELDKLYEKDATQSVFTAIDSFLGYSRPDDVSMEEYTREFNQRNKHLVQTRGKGDLFEDGIRAYFLLQQANLSNNQKVLIRATVSDLSYNNMEDQLKRTYGEDITSSSSSSSLSSGSSFGLKSQLQSSKIGGIGSSSSRSNSLNIKVKEEPTYFPPVLNHSPVKILNSSDLSI